MKENEKQALIKRMEEHKNELKTVGNGKKKKKKKQPIQNKNKQQKKKQQKKKTPVMRKLEALERKIELELKEVNLYFRVSQLWEKEEGQRINGKGYIVWEYGGKTKEEYIKDTGEQTPNRSTLSMIAHAINQLKEPCKINIFTLNAVGGTVMIYKKNWIHRDLGDKILEVVKEGKHEISFYSVDMGCDCQDNLDYVGKKFKKAMLEGN
ncbi:hypothetical protein [Bacillus toyonensis]|uniref:hypothetical protein n=1 Tax=Bacillus toyonensis TaxID=155322 RepID=UPI000BEC3C26|nr:hypothetical protein [Bacillus toyonensis]PED21684.1 hypothetical protein CON63_02265 [Bacillus toyonensis]PEW96361.1 hypothetical protein CN446_17555 [Bacillus cereus]